MKIYIHVPKQKRTKLELSRKKGNFKGYIVSHMEIYCEEKKDSRDDHTVPPSLVVHPSYYREESVDPTGPLDLSRDVAVTKRRPTWPCDTLEDEVRHANPLDTFKDSKRPQIFSSYMAFMRHIMRRIIWLHQW
jgi:hypothetical protein